MNRCPRLNCGLVAIAMSLTIVVCADAQTTRNGQVDEFERARQEQAAEFDDFVAVLEAEWQAWVRADSLAFARFQARISALWGDYRGSTKKDWVEYSGDLTSRTVVDFEAGTATVEVVVPASASAAERAERLRGAVADMIRDPGKTMDYPVLGDAPRPLAEEPVLDGQVSASDGSVVTPASADAFAEDLVANGPVEAVPVVPVVDRSSPKGDDIARIKVTVSTPLVPNHLRVRAEKYVGIVRRAAGRYGLDTRLVLAMIHTESFFNPKARSSAPAFGLMQLVPATGGRDAYELITGTAANPSPNDLYDPVQNIELGCAYLSIIMDRYLVGIQDMQSRLYCSICAYNTGAGNVSRAFTGNNYVKPAVARINNLPPDQVLAKLKRDLPSRETKLYIDHVLKRTRYYEEWKN